MRGTESLLLRLLLLLGGHGSTRWRRGEDMVRSRLRWGV